MAMALAAVFQARAIPGPRLCFALLLKFRIGDETAQQYEIAQSWPVFGSI
jgi:hypothetical protein